MASSKSNHLPKASLPNPLPLRITAPRNPFWGNIALSIAPLKCLMITQIGKRNQDSDLWDLSGVHDIPASEASCRAASRRGSSHHISEEPSREILARAGLEGAGNALRP